MVKLIAKSPCAGLLPLEIGTITLNEVVVETATLVAPFKDQLAAVSRKMPVAFPEPNQISGTDPRAIWVGPGQALLIGGAVSDVPAAVTDQSDGIAVVRASGAAVVDVLARLVPVDLRAMAPGQTARTLIGHMTGSVSRIDAETFEIIVMRSMAGTLVHDLERAARLFFARG